MSSPQIRSCAAIRGGQSLRGRDARGPRADAKTDAGAAAMAPTTTPTSDDELKWWFLEPEKAQAEAAAAAGAAGGPRVLDEEAVEEPVDEGQRCARQNWRPRSLMALSGPSALRADADGAYTPPPQPPPPPPLMLPWPPLLPPGPIHRAARRYAGALAAVASCTVSPLTRLIIRLHQR